MSQVDGESRELEEAQWMGLRRPTVLIDIDVLLIDVNILLILIL